MLVDKNSGLQFESMGDAKTYAEIRGVSGDQRIRQGEIQAKYGVPGGGGSGDSLHARKLSADVDRAEAEARKSVTGEDPAKVAERKSANAQALNGINDLLAKAERNGWKWNKDGTLNTMGKPLTGVNVRSKWIPDEVRRNPVGGMVFGDIEETADNQSLVQSVLNAYLKALTGQGVTLTDTPRVGKATGLELDGAGAVVGARSPKVLFQSVIKMKRDLQSQADEFDGKRMASGKSAAGGLIAQLRAEELKEKRGSR